MTGDSARRMLILCSDELIVFYVAPIYGYPRSYSSM